MESVQQENLQQIDQTMPAIPELTQNIWDTTESWDRLTWLWDWDFMISGGRALRHYLYDHGTIPLWNLFLCGGQPELQNPQSFAFTWASIFFYALPPAPAIMALWVVMSGVGAWSLSKLLQLAGVRSWVSWACSVAYVFSGFFGAHFNQGHATFAFFHLVPLLMLAVARHWQNFFASDLDPQVDSASNPANRFLAIGIVVASFLLFSAPAIQALVYIFPLALLFVVGLAFPANRAQLSSSLKFMASVGVSIGLGALLSSYKFLPVVFESLTRRRPDIFPESYSPGIFLRTFFHFVSRPESMWQDYREGGLFYGWWEYTSFVSPLLAVLTIGFLSAQIFGIIKPSRKREFLPPEHSSESLNLRFRARLGWVAVIGLAVGLLLSLGNTWWLRTLDGLPFGFLMQKFFQSVRVFPRYQVLATFGMIVCSSFVVEIFLCRFLTLQRAFFSIVLVLLLAGPSVSQFVVMVRSIQAIPDREIIRVYELEKPLAFSRETGIPLLANRFLKMPGLLSVQDLIVRRSGVVDECYDPFYPVRPAYQIRDNRYLRTMVQPPLATIAIVSATGFQLQVSPKLDSPLTWNLPLVPEAVFKPEPLLGPDGLNFQPADVAGKKIEVDFPRDSFGFGFVCSGAGLILLGLYLARRFLRHQ